MIGRFLTIGMALLLSACATQQSMMQVSLREDSLEKRMNALEQRQTANENNFRAMNNRIDSLFIVLPQLDSRMARIEDALHDVNTSLVDLKNRPPVVAPTPASTPINNNSTPYVIPENPNPGTPDYAYQEARNLYLKGDYTTAIKDFQAFLGHYPDHELAPNSQYWMGECRYDLKNYNAAINDFRKVVDYYPKSSKAPDASFKVGLCYRKLGQDRQAKIEFEQTLKRYPNYERRSLVEAALKELQ